MIGYSISNSFEPGSTHRACDELPDDRVGRPGLEESPT
jgi:hypothetical protein